MDGGSWHFTGGSDQDHLQETEMQKGKMVVWGGLTNSCEKKRSKRQGEKEIYKHMNAEFQRIARRNKKSYLSDQCKEIEENNRMRKTRSLQENQRYQGNISCKDGLNKGQKIYGPNKSKRYYKEVTRIHWRMIQKDLNDPDNHNGVVTQLEPDILEYEVKCALRSITVTTKKKKKASLGIKRWNSSWAISNSSWALEILCDTVIMENQKLCTRSSGQILNNDAVKVLHSICQQIWKLSSGHRTGKGQISFQSLRKAMPKTVSITT